MKARYVFPLMIFALIFILLWRGLHLQPSQIPSPLINKPAPTFTLPSLMNDKKTTSNQDFQGHVTVVNVWATWCLACAEEHEVLLQIAKNDHVYIYGLDYKDDAVAAKKWLELYNNPYQIVAVDAEGKTAIDWGVYGTPETFILDKKGIIRYKHIGPITQQIWTETLRPLINKLDKET